jgi:YD repeat-containing protein
MRPFKSINQSGNDDKGRVGFQRLLVTSFLLALCALLCSPGVFAFDNPPFDTGHNTSNNGGGPGGGGPGGGGGGGDPVQLESGNFLYDTLDWSFRGRGYFLEVKRTFNTDDFYNGPFGFGWHLDILWEVTPFVGFSGGAISAGSTGKPVLTSAQPSSQSGAIVRRGDGRRMRFTEIGSLTYIPDNEFSRYSLSKQGGNYILTTPDGTTFTFGSNNWPSRAEKYGIGIDYSYDAQDRIQTVTSDLGPSLTFEYGANGRIRKITDHTGRYTTYEYDSQTNLTDFFDQAGNRMQYEYDADHNMTRRISKKGVAFPINNYNSTRQVTSQEYAEGKITFSYPSSSQTKATYSGNYIVDYFFNSAGRPTSIEDNRGSVIEFLWDANQNLLEYKDAGGRTTTYTYDSAGRVIQQVDANGTTVDFIFDSNSGLLDQITKNGVVFFDYTYDAQDRVTQIQHPSGQTSTISYNGLEITVINPEGTSIFTLNEDSFVASEQIGSDPVMTYTYDSIGNIINSQSTAGEFDYSYTAIDRLAAATEDNSLKTTFAYDEVGNLTRVEYPDGTVDVFKYDQFNRLENAVELTGRIALLSYNPTQAVEQNFLRTLGQAVNNQYFDKVWNWEAVLSGS